MLDNKNDFLTLKQPLELALTLDEDLGIKNIIQKKVTWYDNEVLYKIFKVFLVRDNIQLDEKYIFYLKRNGEIVKKLSRDKKLNELQLKKNDEIFVSYNEFKIIDNEIRLGANSIDIRDNKTSERNNGSESSRKWKNKNSQNNFNKRNIKKVLFYLGIILFFIIVALFILLLKYLKKSPTIEEDDNNEINRKNVNIENPIEYKKEKIIIKKSYPLHYLLRFDSRKSTEIEIEGENSTIQNILEINDFIFIVRENKPEKDDINLIEKELYVGYIGLLNHTMINETDEVISIYDKKLNEYINDNMNLKNGNINALKFIGEEGNLCFAKIYFYLNGEIKKYYLPNGFLESDFTYIEDITLLIIPKISPHLYNNNISQTSSKTEKRRLFNNKYKKYTVPYKQINSETNEKNRRTEEKDYIEINYTGPIIVEEYLVEPTTESLDNETREVNEIANDNITQNSSMLSHHSLKTIESDEIKMEDSYTNTSIYSYVDNEGILEYVEKESLSSMVSPDNEDNEESIEDLKINQNEEELKQNNKINFNISIILIINSMRINRTDYFKNESLNQKLYDYFDSFIYNEYNINNNDNNTNSSSKEKYIQNNRNLEEDEEYYGMRKTIYPKDIYNYNLLGLKMKKQILSEMNPAKGITNSYFVMEFGNKNTKIKVDDQQTNLHIILERKNQMAYKLLLLLKQSNIDLELRNKKYIEVILDMEKNVSSFLKDYDYSEIFKDSLNNLYMQVSNFSGEFFYEFISLVNNVYINYTEILNNTMLNKYDFINEIIIITREEYTKYIYNMIDIIEIFENNSLTFFQNLEEEVNCLDNFHIDLLYDIIDIIYDSKQIFKKFNKNLFKSIEKGILSFNYEIKDFINEVMDDILYVIDFLAININKNEIIKKAIDYDSRIEASKNLKGLKNIIMAILDMIIININKDYESQMSLQNENGIKKYSLKKEEEFLINTEEKSDILIGKIKSKINYIELYELYSENLDSINNIINKTINEYIQYSYNNIIKRSINLKPEYLDEESDLKKTPDYYLMYLMILFSN